MGIAGLLTGVSLYFFVGINPAFNGSIQREEVSPSQDNEERFLSQVFADTTDVWNSIFQSNGLRYKEPQLIFYQGSVPSACGRASGGAGPFYCPADRKVYLDLTYFRNGDFASAYVIAHVVGHHVQNLLGVTETFQDRSHGMDHQGRKRSSLRVELQADCLAGVWAKQTEKWKQMLGPDEIERAISAFTHGTAKQRITAFERGNASGNTQTCLDSYSFQ